MISIVVPVHNTAPYLRRCIDSILNQTHRDFEVLLAENASTDNSGEICDAYAQQDARVRVFHLPVGGVSNARNVALDNARGSYAAFVDSDDWIEPDMLAELWSRVDGSGTDAAMCDAWNVDGEKRSKAKFCAGLAAEAQGWEVNRIFWVCSGVVWNKLLGMQCIGNVRFDLQYAYCEDVEFLHRIAPQVQRLRIVPQPLYNYRRNREGNVTSAKLNAKYSDLLAIMDMAADELLRHDCLAEAATRVRMGVGKTLRAAGNVPLKESKPYRDRCKQMLRKCRAHWLLLDKTKSMPVRVMRMLEYAACKASPALVVLIYKLRRLGK